MRAHALLGVTCAVVALAAATPASGPSAPPAVAESPVVAGVLWETGGATMTAAVTRPRQVRMVKCRHTLVDPVGRTVLCLRPRSVSVWAVRSSGRWAVAKSSTGRFAVVPYVWSKPRKALVFSPRLAWRDRQGETSTPTDPGPPRKPETPVPPAPVPVEGGGEPTSFALAGGLSPAEAVNAPRWDRCTRIRWAADLSRAAAYGIDPEVALAAVSTAFAEAAAITGYTFEFVGRADGELTQQTTTPEGVEDAPWSARYEIGVTVGAEGDPSGYDFPGISFDGVGFAHMLWQAEAGSALQSMRLATVMIDAVDVLAQGALDSVARHEVAHVLGLDHVDDPTQLMYPALVDGLSTYQNGDRAGLWLIASQPCFPTNG